MRISEIYLAKVFDRDGTELGRVDDVRFSVVAARPADAYAAIAPDAELWPFGKVRHRFGGPVTYKLTGFVCSSGPAIGHRLGYGAGPLPGPWLVRSLLALLRSRTAVVEWSDVNHVDSAGVHLHRTGAELGIAP